jgi:hypothetical protein
VYLPLSSMLAIWIGGRTRAWVESRRDGPALHPRAIRVFSRLRVSWLAKGWREFSSPRSSASASFRNHIHHSSGKPRNRVDAALRRRGMRVPGGCAAAQNRLRKYRKLSAELPRNKALEPS